MKIDHTLQTLSSLKDDDLLRRLLEILKSSRRIEADLVAHIAEVDARRLYARYASSMFYYCTQVLHFPESETGLRIEVARACRKRPVLLDMIADGRLHLSGVMLISRHLTPENEEMLLDRATHRTKEQIKELIAEIAPKPDVPSSMRKLPDSRKKTKEKQTSPGPDRVDSPSDALGPDRVKAVKGPSTLSGPDRVDTSSDSLGPDRVNHQNSLGPDRVESGPGADGQPSPPTKRPLIEPLSPARYKIQFTASAELRDKLERLRALMRSSVHDGDIGAIIKQAVTEKLERLEARRFGQVKNPRKSLEETDTTPDSRSIPAAVKRAVCERDQNQCTFREDTGRRCAERRGLEFHHKVPFKQGGDHSVGNIFLLCRTHNLHQAERDYGKEVMEHYRQQGELVYETPAMYRLSNSIRVPDSSAIRTHPAFMSGTSRASPYRYG